MKTGRYEEGARNRQDVLDYVIEHPGAMAPEIIKALNLGKMSGARRLQQMTDTGELSRIPALHYGINSIGVKFCQKTFSYTAIVTKTRMANEVDEKKQSERKGVISNTKADRPVTPNPDAQYSGGGIFGIRSTLG